MVLLIGNYTPDQQQSMQRFSTMMLQGLTAAGISAELIQPEPFFGSMRGFGSFTKWLAYIDKFLLFPGRLRARMAQGVSLIHITDHSNAIYAARCQPVPVVVTCHDLLAVRGALGEETDCPASAAGVFLQRWILRGLRRARHVACVSRATLADARRLLDGSGTKPEMSVITLDLNYPYRQISPQETTARLRTVAGWDPETPYILHVGSNLKRKNRAGVLRIFARTHQKWSGQLILAGDPLTPDLQSLGENLGISARIIEVVQPESPLLEALYNRATALLYPSRFEGFGWPIAEAQACGCPVICGASAPLPEVAGEAGLIHPLDDEESFAADILRLLDEEERAHWSAKSLRNAERFSAAGMIAKYVEIYRRLAPQL